MKQVDLLFNGLPACTAALLLITAQDPALGQENAGEGGVTELPADQAGADSDIEEVVVTGRFISSSQQLVNERMNDATVTDLLGEDTIQRLGDSTVGAALRRVPGLSLVADKYVYIRGLGERYSASYLNGAQIPSPDLTRNVIPLDVFPTSVVHSLRVQKAWSPNLPANFGGGSVDIRTKGVPDSFLAQFEVGGGYNSLSSGDGLTYPGGGDDWLGSDDGTRALSPTIQAALNEFQGDLSTQNILTFMRRQDPTATLADAQAVNRQLGLDLNRNIGVQSKKLPMDLRLRGGIGNKYAVGQDWQLGFGVGGSYQTDWRKTKRVAINYNFPDQRTDTQNETTYSVNMAGILNLGATYLGEHDITTTTLWLRNTDDETAVSDFFNENREISDGLGWRGYRLQFEERNLLTNQIRGTHELGEATRERFPFLKGLLGWVPPEATVSWFYSDSKATTDIPNQVEIASQTVTDPVTTEVLAEQVALNNTAGDFRFTDLEDKLENYGWSFALPLTMGRNDIELSGGYNHAQKARTYKQTELSLGVNSVSDISALQGPLDTVFSDTNILDTSNNWLFARQGANNESYIAATMTDGIFGNVDWTYDDTWRVALGGRWEDYRQAAVEWNPYGYSLEDPQVTTDADVLAEGTFAEDKFYPAAAVTYMGDWLADTFQLRFGWSQTAVRPDLREITGSSYIDPITGDLTRGSTGVKPAEVNNYDVRAEWFFESGDNLTITYFRKDIDKPIEYFESAASDTTVAREILNATDATVQGVEIEGLKKLDFLGGIFETLFVQGNMTFQDSELRCIPDSGIPDAGLAPPAPDQACNADAPTNPVRKLSGASDYVVNLMLGFDSPNARHTASLIYNVFGERLYVAGRNGSPDGFEQPFHSLDFTYFWYPTETITLKLKAQNLLDEATTIERGGVTTYTEEPGQTFAIAFNLSF